MTKEQIKRANQILVAVAEYREDIKKLSKKSEKIVGISDKYQKIIAFSVNHANGALKEAMEKVISETIIYINNRITALEKELEEM